MSPELKRRVARQLFIRLSKECNPYFVLSASEDSEITRKKWMDWNDRHMNTVRALSKVVFNGAELTDDLIKGALDIIEGLHGG